MTDTPSRKLAVLLHADVVGSTALVQKNESVAHQRILAAFQRLSATTSAYGGIAREIRGDALVAEFSRASDAVCAAMAFQADNADHNAVLEDSILPKIRVGISLGEVVVADGTVTGAGVVLAQRLEQLADAGEVVVQGAVSETVPIRLPFEFESLGEQMLKGFDQPVRSFVARLKPGMRIPRPDSTTKDAEPSRTIAHPAENIVPLELPDKPSIAVLPLTNLSGDPEQEYFSDGITEDIVTNLSRIRWLFVIARNSSFVFKGKAVDVRSVSSELGVRYILEGSIRRAANTVRISVQLIDATTTANIWAERYDRELADIFAVQDEITRSVAASIEPQLLAAEGLRARSRGRDDLDAWDLVIRALHSFWRLKQTESAVAISMLEDAVRRYPEYGPAQSMLAFSLLISGHMGWREAAISWPAAKVCADKAMSIDDQDAWAHIALGYLHFVDRHADEAIAEFSKALDLNPNFAAAYGYRGLANAHAGRSEEASSDTELALRLSPKDPQNAIFIAVAGLAHYLAGRTDDAIKNLAESVRLRPELLAGKRTYCAALARAGNLIEARGVMEEIKRLQPDVSASLLLETLPYSSPRTLIEFVDDLRKAGLPE